MSTRRRATMGGSSSKPAEAESNGLDDENVQDFAVASAINDLQRLCAQFHKICSHPGCQMNLPAPIYRQLFQAWAAGSQQIPPQTQLSVLVCHQGHLTCVGCGESPTIDPTKCLFTSLGVINHCCDRGRLFAIWCLLCRFDEKNVLSKLPKKKAGKKTKPVPKPTGKAKAVSGVGYGEHDGMLAWEMMDGIGGNPYAVYQAGRYANNNDEEEREDEEMSQDFLLIDTIKLLNACLPDLHADTCMELTMFRLSSLLDKIIQMIRNDSIVDITQRFDVYEAITGFIEQIAAHPGLLQLLFDERQSKTTGIGELVTQGFIYQSEGVSRSKPLIASYGNTFLQAKTYLSMSKHDSSDGWRARESLNLLEHMVQCFELLQNIEKRTNPVIKEDVFEPEVAWTKFVEDNKVTFSDDVLRSHRFATDIKALQSSNRGRLNTISKEIATMKTSLPPGIFLKVADSRSDAMKVLMIGSEGSPYAGGLFIFDIFLDAKYPLTPPKMIFTMRGNDEDGESFNPNLHIHSGTVCLSLLNTWPGHPSEAWQPHKSTLLSVLVSVQAMILGAPLPWENEPGYEGSGETPSVLAHKSRVQSRTVRFAMIAWIENNFADPKAKEYIWKDISQTYWKHNAKKVLEYVKEWVHETPGLLCYGMTDYWTRLGKTPRARTINVQQGSGYNLFEKLSESLGFKYDPVEFESEMKIALSQTKRKPGSLKTPGSGKKQKLETAGKKTTSSLMTKWAYTGEKNQKTVKKACKEFGVGYRSSIAASVEKLESYVNENLHEVEESLIVTWGEFEPREVEPSELGILQNPFNPYAALPVAAQMGELLTHVKTSHSSLAQSKVFEDPMNPVSQTGFSFHLSAAHPSLTQSKMPPAVGMPPASQMTLAQMQEEIANSVSESSSLPWSAYHNQLQAKDVELLLKPLAALAKSEAKLQTAAAAEKAATQTSNSSHKLGTSAESPQGAIKDFFTVAYSDEIEDDEEY